MDEIDKEKHLKLSGPADHLANERTFLAWIRTSIAFMGFGFVIVKFALFLRQMSIFLGAKAIPAEKGYSGTIGVVMVFLGAIISILAYLRYRNIEKQLNENTYFPSGWLSAIVTLIMVFGSIFLTIYLFKNL